LKVVNVTRLSISPRPRVVGLVGVLILIVAVSVCSAFAMDDQAVGPEGSASENNPCLRGVLVNFSALEAEPHLRSSAIGGSAPSSMHPAKTKPSDRPKAFPKLRDLAKKLPVASKQAPARRAAPRGMQFQRGAPELKRRVQGPSPKKFKDSPARARNERNAHWNLATNFESLPQQAEFPADSNLAVGPNHVVHAVNNAMRITDKTGAGALDVAFADFFQPNPGDETPFDPWIAYDQHAQRWVLLTLTRSTDKTRSWYMLAASQSDDPTGGWWIYPWRADLDGMTESNNWADYAKFALDDTNVYITSNQFSSAGLFQYAKIRAFAKAPLYAGQPLNGVDWANITRADNSLAFTIQPCSNLDVMAAGPEYFVASSSGPDNTVTVWTIDQQLATLTRNATVEVGVWDVPDQARQGGTMDVVDSGDARLLRGLYSHGNLYTCHTIKSEGFPSACGYIVIDTPSFSPSLDVAFGAPEGYYYYPSLMVDDAGTIASAYSYSDTSTFISALFTTKAVNDPQFAESSLLKQGLASYVQKDDQQRNRWGDYNGLARDPTGGFWMSAMYPRSVVNTWGTWVGNLQAQ
jgi:hypothetical protein